MNCSTRSSLAARRISSSARALARVAIRISMASMLLITRCTTEWPKAKRKVSQPLAAQASQQLAAKASLFWTEVRHSNRTSCVCVKMALGLTAQANA